MGKNLFLAAIILAEQLTVPEFDSCFCIFLVKSMVSRCLKTFVALHSCLSSGRFKPPEALWTAASFRWLQTIERHSH